jgi:hypothetical protein
VEAAATASVAQNILAALNQPYPIGGSLHHSTPASASPCSAMPA